MSTNPNPPDEFPSWRDLEDIEVGESQHYAPARFSTCYPCNISSTRRGNIMLAKPSKTADEDLPQGRMLTEEEDREMQEHLARHHFDMSLEEFKTAWKAGKFDGDKEKHGDVVFLASMLPEYWGE